MAEVNNNTIANCTVLKAELQPYKLSSAKLNTFQQKLYWVFNKLFIY